MKQSNIILLVVLFVAGLGTLYVINSKENPKSSLETEAQFAIKDTDQIGKIFLANRIAGTEITLKREGDKWIVNDDFEAHPLVVSSLLSAMRSMQIKYRPSKNAYQNIAKGLAADQVKTEIYDKNDKLIKTYYVGGETSDSRGTYIIMEGSNTPFVAELKNLTGTFRPRFDISIKDLRKKNLIEIKDINNIEYISFEYPKNKNRSFIYQKINGKHQVRPFFDYIQPNQGSINNSAVENYLANFLRIGSEDLLDNDKGDEPFKSYTPFAKLTIKLFNGNKNDYVFYPISTVPGNKFKDPVVERFNVTVNNQYDVVHLTQMYTLKPIFLGYEAFF